MGCCTEVSEPVISAQFKLKQSMQKYLIDFILSYSSMNSSALAEILEVSPIKLSQVLAGITFLESVKARNLFQYFMMLIGD